MSYKALYRKYRPTNFDDVIGQSHIVSTLNNIINNNKISHAYLFSGPRGTGKTSVAHIFANKVNNKNYASSNKEQLDIIELDGASNNGVTEIRNIISNINYLPGSGEYKVYIIDEVHMLTKGAFNALLKTLEEPPKHVIFILATTEPHKIPITILSRVQRFNFRKIDNIIIENKIKEIIKKEGIKADNESIKFISILASGSVRDALSITDQVSAFSNGKINFKSISLVFGVQSIQSQINIINSIYAGEANEVMTKLSFFLDNGMDVEIFSINILEIIKDYIVYNKTQNNSLLNFITFEDYNNIDINLIFAYKFIDILIKLMSNLKFAINPRQILELSILESINDTVIKKELKEEKELPKHESVINKKKEFESLQLTSEISTNEQEIENSLLSTQEIPLEETTRKYDDIIKDDIDRKLFVSDFTKEMPIKEEEPPENDISKIFEEDEEQETSEIHNIINLFMQPSEIVKKEFKNKWLNFEVYTVNKEFANFASIIKNTKIISVGENFILVSSNDDDIIDEIKINQKNSTMLNLLNKVFGRPIHLFAISKYTFQDAKKEYMELLKSNNLPKKIRKIQKPNILLKKMTEKEKTAQQLFGDVFTKE